MIGYRACTSHTNRNAITSAVLRHRDVIASDNIIRWIMPIITNQDSATQYLPLMLRAANRVSTNYVTTNTQISDTIPKANHRTDCVVRNYIVVSNIIVDCDTVVSGSKNDVVGNSHQISANNNTRTVAFLNRIP